MDRQSNTSPPKSGAHGATAIRKYAAEASGLRTLSAGEIFDRKITLAYFTGAPNFWAEAQVLANVLDKHREYPGSRAYDSSSIMNYKFPEELLLPGKETHPGNDLSESDKAYVASLYPKG